MPFSISGSMVSVKYVRFLSIPDSSNDSNAPPAHWSGPKLAYAETGEIEKPDWNFKEICTPNKYAAEIESWINNYGVQIIGGCCGTGPEHIQILKDRLPQHLPVSSVPL